MEKDVKKIKSRRKRNDAFVSVQFVPFSVRERIRMLFAKGYVIEVKGEPNRNPSKPGNMEITTFVPAWPWQRLWRRWREKRKGIEPGFQGTEKKQPALILSESAERDLAEP
jgi:hypothetical protein